MASNTQIANMALAYLGVDPITDLTEDSSQAKKINAIYSLTRDSLLEEHFWNFAIKRTSLAKLSETPTFEYNYFFQLPTDFVRLVAIDQGYEYRIEQDRLATNVDSVKIEYVYKLTDPAKFSDQFVNLFALRLACDLAYPLTGSGTAQDRFEVKYNNALRKAKTIDSQQGTHRDKSSNTWISVRSDDFGRPVYNGVVNA